MMLKHTVISVVPKKASRMSCVIRATNSDDQSPSKVLRKKLESQRAPVAKENLNKLAAIASADGKFLNEVFSELDKLHKTMFDNLSKKMNIGQKTEQVIEDESENIFLKKD